MRYLLIVILFTGCSTVWQRPPGASVQQFNQDNYACEYGTAMVPQGSNPWSPNLTNDGWTGAAQAGTALQNEGQAWFHRAYQARLYRMCMEARGYTKQ